MDQICETPPGGRGSLRSFGKCSQPLNTPNDWREQLLSSRYSLEPTIAKAVAALAYKEVLA